jgi:hypothetical protein
MHFNTLFTYLAALAAADTVAAGPLLARETAPLANRETTPTSTSTSTRTHTTLPPDPVQCATENISQYFDVPTPTDNVFDAIDTFGAEAFAACHATAVRPVTCTFTDLKSWCAFTTAAPADALSSYSAGYLSSAVSFWTEKSASMSVLATICPRAWRRYSEVETLMVGMAVAHAECYLAAHQAHSTQPPVTTTGSTNVTPTAAAAAGSTSATASSGANALLCGRTVTLVGVALAILAHTA